MKKVSVSAVFLVLGLFLVAGVAMAGDCKPVHTNLVPGADYLSSPDCMFQGFDFYGCIDTQIRGTLNGNFRWHYTEDNLSIVETPFPGYAEYIAYWGIGVISTQKGEIWVQGAGAAHPDLLPPNYPDLVASETYFIFGGTGDYVGASGWIGGAFTEATGGKLTGEICTQ